MNELTGEDAFDRVLDRMVAAEKRAATAEEATHGSRHEIAALQQTLNNARSDLTTAKVRLDRYENSDDAFIALYDVINDAIGVMRTASGSCQSAGSAADLLSRADGLQAKMTEARKFIDPIPF